MATNAAALPNPQLARLGAGVRPFLVLMGIAAAVAAGAAAAGRGLRGGVDEPEKRAPLFSGGAQRPR